MKKKSITTNGIYAVISKVFGIFVPLVVLPFVLRRLGVESYGKVSFAQSLEAYFVLLATLGIENYALRECALVKDDTKSLQHKVSQIFTISLFTTFFAFVSFNLCAYFIKEETTDYMLYFIISFSILSSGMMMNWLYYSYERFDLISVRNILGRCVYFVLCFLLIKDSGDYVLYVALYVFSLSLIPLFFNHFGIWKGKCGVVPRFQIDSELKKCLISVFFLGLMTLGSKLFSSADTLLTKWLAEGDGNKEVGLYNSGILLPLVIEQLLMTIVSVVSPRIYYHIGQNQEKQTLNLTNLISNSMYLVAVPAVLTCVFFPDILMSLLGGGQYQGASGVLRIYSLVLLTSVAITLAGTRTYVARKKEKKLFVILITMAIFNIILNIIFYQIGGIKGIASATVLSNVLLMIIELSLEKTWYLVFTKDKLTYLYGGIFLMISFIFARYYFEINSILTFILCIIVIGIGYMSFMYILKESTIMLFLVKSHLVKQ